MVIDWGMTVRKVIVYGTLFVLFILAMMLLFAVTNSPVIVALFAGGFLFIQYFFSDTLVLWSTGAQIVSETEAPQLHMMVEKLCLNMGLPKPRIAIINNDMPNAFATGRNKKKAVVAVTTGIMGTLNERELEAVLAHELTHIRNRDMFVVTFASFVVSLLSYIIYIIFATIFSRDEEGNFGASMAAAMVSMILSNTIGLIIINTVSRYREYGADRGSAYATNNPDGLISALKKISGSNYSSDSARALDSAKALCISPTTRNAIFELFSTHPTIEKRINELEKIKREMRGY